MRSPPRTASRCCPADPWVRRPVAALEPFLAHSAHPPWLEGTTASIRAERSAYPDPCPLTPTAAPRPQAEYNTYYFFIIRYEYETTQLSKWYFRRQALAFRNHHGEFKLVKSLGA